MTDTAIIVLSGMLAAALLGAAMVVRAHQRTGMPGTCGTCGSPTGDLSTECSDCWNDRQI